MTIYDILEDIAANGSKKNKLAIIESHKGNNILKEVFFLAYSKSIRFGIKKVPELKEATGVMSLWAALDFMKTKLATREITGNAAISALTDVLEQLSHDDQIVAIRVLTKDLRIGASGSSANKTWKGLIAEQPQMLASPCSDKTLKNIVYPAYSQLKADGSRCFIEVSDSGVQMFSRSGKEYLGLGGIADEAYSRWVKFYRVKYPNGIMIDGEIVSYTENGVQSRTQSNGFANKSLSGTISEEEANTMVHECWDIVDLDEVYKGKSSELYNSRYADLLDFCSGLSSFKVIETKIVHNEEEAKLDYNRYLSLGLEGSILKNIKSYWEDKRSKNLVKFKEIITIDLEVVDYYPHSQDPNKIGGLTCRTSDGVILVDIGSGLTDTDEVKTGEVDANGNNVYETIPIELRSETNRARLFLERDSLKGRIVECQCNGYLFSKTWKPGDTIATFLGVFKQFRIDKSEANTFEDAFGVSFEDAVKTHLGN